MSNEDNREINKPVRLVESFTPPKNVGQYSFTPPKSSQQTNKPKGSDSSTSGSPSNKSQNKRD